MTQKRKAKPPKDDEADRKERVLHTRVPAVLEDELKRLATNLRVPVSNVVRAVLEDAVTAADVMGRRAEGGLRGWAERLASERDRLRQRVGSRGGDSEAGEGPSEPAEERDGWVDPLEGVLGFQPLVLATDSACAVCGRALEAGDEAFLGIRMGAGPKVVLGQECLPGRTNRKETKS